jgi:hypothetical protein
MLLMTCVNTFVLIGPTEASSRCHLYHYHE